MQYQAFDIVRVEEIGPHEWRVAGRALADITLGDILECELQDDGIVNENHFFTVTHIMAFNHSLNILYKGVGGLLTLQGRQSVFLLERTFLVFSTDHPIQ